ncbi:MAG: cytochrome c5 family protein [Gammaproteobacteria bacterium]
MDHPQNNAEQDAVFVRNFAIVLLLLAGIGVAVYFIAAHVYSDFKEERADDASIGARIAPVGNLNTSGEPVAIASTAAAPGNAGGAETAAAAPAASSPGEAAYNKVCFACHGAGIAGAPKIGDKAAWEPRVAQGTDTLYKHAIEGLTGQTGMMPPKGGAADMSDDDVKAAVDFMLTKLDGAAAASAPAAAPPAEAAVPAATPADAAATAAAAAPATADAGAKGKEIYDSVCFVCHGPGAAGAPKLGDAAAWGERIAQGNDVLYDHAINGFMGKAGMMPPKGGRPDVADADVKAAVDYMVDASK